MVPASSRRAPASLGPSSCSSVVPAPSIAASGVRRSCDSELSSVVRSRSASTATSVRRLRSARVRRSKATAACPARASSRRRCPGSRNWCRLRRADADHPDRAVGYRERHVQRHGRRQRARAVPGGLALIVGPLRDADLAIVERIGQRLDRLQPPGCLGQQQDDVGGEGVVQMLQDDARPAHSTSGRWRDRGSWHRASPCVARALATPPPGTGSGR